MNDSEKTDSNDGDHEKINPGVIDMKIDNCD